MALPCRPWKFRVKCELAEGETACVVGSVPELGSWYLSSAVELQPEAELHGADAAQNGSDGSSGAAVNNGGTSDNGGPVHNGSARNTESVCGATVTLRSDREVHYRYCICVILTVDGERKVVIRRWETEIAPRHIPCSDLVDESCYSQLDNFGHISPVRHVDRGWLNVESVVQLKLYNNPVELWKQRQTKFRLKVTPVNLAKKMLAEPLQAGEESSETDTHGFRSGSAWPIMEISVLVDGQTSFSPQEQFGRQYHADEFFTFQCQMLKPETIAYMVDLYSATGSDEGAPEHLGFCHILPKNLTETNGTLTLPISGTSHRPIGQLTVDYLVVRPMEGVRCSMDACYSRYWGATWRGLDVGHRGAGNSFTPKPEVCANIRENTIASMRQAIEHGADFVEFDIQLSKDLTPLIYHDFHIGIALRNKDIVSGHHILRVPLKDLEHHQLLQLQTYHLEESEMGSHHLENDSMEDNQPFPTLDLAFQTLDPHVGFNIEIKWTMQLEDGSFELYHPFELNSYIDNILRVVLAHSGSRKIIFSCFHPDICTMLRLKQNQYPVLFLTQGETDQWPPYRDARTCSLQKALLFARSAQILGVNAFSGVLLQQPDFIKRAQDQGLVVFCWGDENASVDTIRYLKSQGCDAVIYDRMDKYCTKDTKESIFLMEARQANQMSLRGYDTLSDASTGSDTAAECTEPPTQLQQCPPGGSKAESPPQAMDEGS